MPTHLSEHPVVGFAASVAFSLSVRWYYRSVCQLKVLCQDSEANRELINKCKSLSQYRPTPFYLLDYYGHVATIALTVVRQLFNRSLPVDRELFKISDGGTVGLDWVLETTDRPYNPDRPLAVLVHGLCGDTDSVYITFAARALQKRGYDVVSFVSRGCGGLTLTTMEGFHAAKFSDLSEALEHIRKQKPSRPIFCAGFSLGAGILLNYLGAVGDKSVLKGAVAISPSWDFLKKTPAFHLWSSMPLIIGLKLYVRNHLELLKNSKMDVEAVLNSKNVSEFDQHAVVAMHGFTDLNHYYTESSACRRAHNISTPTLAVSAEDDPVCSAEGCPSIVDEFGEGLVVVRTTVGGHVAFGAGFLPGVKSWMDDAVCDWFDSCRS